MFFDRLNCTSLVNSFICCCNEVRGTAVDELEDELEEEDEKVEVVAGVRVEGVVEFGREDGVSSSIVIPSSEFAHEVAVDVLEEVDDRFFLTEEEILRVVSVWITLNMSTMPLITFG